MRGVLLEQLRGGDRRSIGRAGEVAEAVLARPELFPVLMEGITGEDPLVRMRSADAAEKVTRSRPEWLRGFGEELLAVVQRSTAKEVRWNVVQMLPRVPWGARERRRVVELLIGLLRDSSRIVATCAMQGLADLAAKDASLVDEAARAIEEAAKSGSAAMAARGRKLLRALKPVF